MKMKRRGFLKAIGAVVGGALCPGAARTTAKPCKPISTPPTWATGGPVTMERVPVFLAPGEMISANGSAYGYHVQIHVSEVESFIASLDRSRPQIESIMRGNIR